MKKESHYLQQCRPCFQSKILALFVFFVVTSSSSSVLPPRGNVFDVSFPIGVPLGLLLNGTTLSVSGFRSHQVEMEKRASLEKLRAVGRINDNVNQEVMLDDKNNVNSNSNIDKDVDGTSQPRKTTRGLAAPSSSVSSYSLAEFSGQIMIGDVLIGVGGKAVWGWPISQVMDLISSTTITTPEDEIEEEERASNDGAIAKSSSSSFSDASTHSTVSGGLKQTLRMRTFTFVRPFSSSSSSSSSSSPPPPSSSASASAATKTTSELVDSDNVNAVKKETNKEEEDIAVTIRMQKLAQRFFKSTEFKAGGGGLYSLRVKTHTAKQGSRRLPSSSSSTSVVSLTSSPLIGAIFSSDFVLLSTDPVLTERMITRSSNGDVAKTSTLKSDVTTEQETNDLIELMQGSGQLGGRAWPGDILVAINGEVLPTSAFFQSSEKVASSTDEVKIARKRSLEILLRAMGVNASQSVEPLSADFSIIALGASFSHNSSDSDTSLDSDLATVTIAASLRSEGGGGSVCFAGGRFCTSLSDIDSNSGESNSFESEIEGGSKRTFSPSAGATVREIRSVLKGRKVREKGGGGEESAEKGDYDGDKERGEIVFTFRRSLVLPTELVPFSRHAAVAQALVRSSTISSSSSVNNGDAVTLSVSELNTENEGASGRNGGGGDDNVLARTIVPNVERAVLTCNRAASTTLSKGGDSKRCSFKSADVAVVKARVLRSETRLSSDPKEETIVTVREESTTDLPLADKQASSSPSSPSSSSSLPVTMINAIPALFGGSFPCGGARRVVITGGHACDVLGEFQGVGNQPRTAEQPYAGAVVVATRGGCSFIDKANAVQSNGAAALLVVADKGTPPIAMPAFEVDVSNNRASSSDSTGAAVLDPVTGRRKARKLHSEQKMESARQRSVSNLPVIAVAMIEFDAFIQLRKLSEFANSTGGIIIAEFATDSNPEFDLCSTSSSSSSSSSTTTTKGPQQKRSSIINSSANADVETRKSDPRSEARLLSNALRKVKRHNGEGNHQNSVVESDISVNVETEDEEFIKVSDLDALFVAELEEFLRGEKRQVEHGQEGKVTI